MGGVGKTDSTHPVFFDGQEKAGGQGIAALTQRLFGGGPDFGSEQAAARGHEDVIRSAAAAGFAASDPVTQARQAQVDVAKVSSEDQMWMTMLDRLFTPAGSGGGGGWNANLLVR